MLRSLIQGEIEAALMNENGYRFSFEQEQANDQGWETFINFFIKEETEWTETGSGV
jgi:hypothetical protein